MYKFSLIYIENERVRTLYSFFRFYIMCKILLYYNHNITYPLFTLEFRNLIMSYFDLITYNPYKRKIRIQNAYYEKNIDVLYDLIFMYAICDLFLLSLFNFNFTTWTGFVVCDYWFSSIILETSYHTFTYYNSNAELTITKFDNTCRIVFHILLLGIYYVYFNDPIIILFMI